MNRIITAVISLALALMLLGCGSGKTEETEQQASVERRISSIMYYNKTGNIQREDIYTYDETGNASVNQQIVYSYNDRGKLTNIKREAGGPGYDKDMESYFYMGENCTQKISFNENGSSSEVYYWKYYDSGAVKSETHTVMLTSITKNEEIKEFSEDGVLTKLTESTSECYRYHEYVYSEETGLLSAENLSFSPTGKRADTEDEGCIKYYYSENNLLLKTVTLNIDGIATGCTVYEYDEKDNLISKKTFSSGEPDESSLVSSETKEFDALGELIFEAYTDADGSGNSVEYRFDSSGNVIRKTERSFGETDTELITETEYDIHNNPIKQMISNGSAIKIVEFECSYEYYDSGAVKTCTYYQI